MLALVLAAAVSYGPSFNVTAVDGNVVVAWPSNPAQYDSGNGYLTYVGLTMYSSGAPITTAMHNYVNPGTIRTAAGNVFFYGLSPGTYQFLIVAEYDDAYIGPTTHEWQMTPFTIVVPANSDTVGSVVKYTAKSVFGYLGNAIAPASSTLFSGASTTYVGASTSTTAPPPPVDLGSGAPYRQVITVNHTDTTTATTCTPPDLAIGWTNASLVWHNIGLVSPSPPSGTKLGDVVLNDPCRVVVQWTASDGTNTITAQPYTIGVEHLEHNTASFPASTLPWGPQTPGTYTYRCTIVAGPDCVAETFLDATWTWVCPVCNSGGSGGSSGGTGTTSTGHCCCCNCSACQAAWNQSLSGVYPSDPTEFTYSSMASSGAFTRYKTWQRPTYTSSILSGLGLITLPTLGRQAITVGGPLGITGAYFGSASFTTDWWNQNTGIGNAMEGFRLLIRSFFLILLAFHCYGLIWSDIKMA